MGSKSSDKNSSDLLPSTSSSFMTSTLLPTKRSNNNNNNNNNSSNNALTLSNKKRPSSRYTSMGTVGRACGNTVRRSRQNVAIATQVLNPSAIGGSLKGQREAKHFGPPDDDEEGFITYRRSAAWKKLCYYGSAIVVVILLLMAIILGVGYMQSEKHKRILSRSVKLIQEKNPTSYIYISTTPDPPSLEPTDSHEFFPTAQSSFLLSSRKEDDSGEGNGNEFIYSSGETSKNVVDEDEDDDYLNYNNHEDETTSYRVNGQIVAVKSNKKPLLLLNNDHIVEDHDNETNNGDNNRATTKGESQEVITSSGEKLDNDLDAVIVDHESVDDVNNNEDWKSADANTEKKTADEKHEDEAGHNDRMHTEVKVLPPDDFVFSIEIPIYKPNNTISAASDNNKEGKEAAHDSAIEKDDDESLAQPSDEVKLTNSETKAHDLGDDKQEAESGEVAVEVDEEGKETSAEVEAQEKSDIGGDLTTRFLPVLHTALFENTDSPPLSIRMKDSSPTITITRYQDGELEVTSTEEDVSLNYHPESSDSEELSRSRGRNRKIKIMKNDKVMNLKATYTPPLQSPKEDSHSSQTRETSKVDDKASRKLHSFAHILRLNEDRRHGVDHVLNKTLALKQKTKGARKSSDFENLKDFVVDTTSTQRKPLASSTQHVSFPGALAAEEKFEEKPRLLSSSSPLLSNFEAYLKAILSEPTYIGDVNVKSGSQQKPEPKRVIDQHHHASDFGNNFAFNLNQFIPPTEASPLGASPALDSSQFSKRTYNQYDFDFHSPLTSASAPVTQNYFEHLLGQNPSVGTIGSPSAAGASLSNYYSPIFPFPSPSPGGYDISTSSTNDQPSLAPGSVPLDLASSFIQVGLPAPQSSQSAHRQGANNPYGSGGAGVNPYTFQFSNSPSDKVGNGGGGNQGLGTLTTITGQPPTYNTISQGIHLLNMISNTNSAAGAGNPFFQDQSIYNSPATSPTSGYQQDTQQSQSQFHLGSFSPTTSSLSEYNQDEFLKSIGAIPQHVPPPQPSRSRVDYRDDHQSEHPHQHHRSTLSHSSHSHPGRSSLISKEDTSPDFSEEEQDQLPAASSFSQSILTTFQSPVIKKLSSSVESSTLKNTIALLTKSRRRTQNNLEGGDVAKKTQSEPKSFSFEILPGRGGTSRKDLSSNNVIEDTLKSLNADVIHTSLDNFVSGSKSKKKGSVSLDTPSKIIKAPPTTPTSSRGTTLKLKGSNLRNGKPEKPTKRVPLHEGSFNNKTAKGNSNGLKSGFFVI